MPEAKKRDFAIHINSTLIVGRVVEPPKIGDKLTRVRVVVPGWKKGGGRQWIPFAIDVFGDHRDKVKGVKPSDFLKCTCFIAERPVVNDAGEKRTVKVLQADGYRQLVVMPESATADVNNPPMDERCFSHVLLAGRNFVRKKEVDAGKLTPELREGNNGAYCYLRLKYEDPFQDPPPEGEYYSSIFFDISLNGDVAKVAAEHCRNRAQLMIVGELGKQERDFTVRGQTPREPKIMVAPGGFHFLNLDRGSSQQSKPAGVQGYELSDEGLDSGPKTQDPVAAEDRPPPPEDDSINF